MKNVDNGEMLQKAREYEKSQLSKNEKVKRPEFHFSPPSGWINDPNGFSEFNGEYHLFFQYYPFENSWNSMHWGHTKTNDFIKWEYIPAALAPDKIYDNFGVFSGSAIEDNGKHVLMYTGVSEVEVEDNKKEIRQTQCIAIGDGIEYTKIDKNPVIKADMLPKGSSLVDFRDPKMWKEDGIYYSVVGSRADDGSGQIALFSSENLIDWEFCSIIDKCNNEYGKMWECPDLFKLEDNHILMVSPQDMLADGLEFHNGNGTMFIVGNYDNKTKSFKRESVQSVDYGLDFYAPQTMKTSDGRRIMVAWLKSWDNNICIDGSSWIGMMTLPRELKICQGRVIQNPVKEIENYYLNKYTFENFDMGIQNSIDELNGRIFDLKIDIHEGSYGKFEIKLAQNEKYYTAIRYDFEEQVLTFDRTYSGLCRDFNSTRSMFVKNKNGKVKIRILLDRYSVEIFANDGTSAMTSVITTPEQAKNITWNVQGKVIADIEKNDIKL